MSIGQRLLAATVAWATMSAAPVRAQSPSLEAAIRLYTSASYDEALVALEGSRELPLSPGDRVELERHQMLCLLALGRTAAAVEAAARLLEHRPDYVLSEVDAAPHVRAMLEKTRRRVVPGMIRRTYEDGKRAFDAGEYGRAREVFTQLGQWLADTHVAGADPGFADLRTLSDGFLQLSMSGAARPASESVAPEAPTALLATAHPGLSWSAVTAVRMEPASIDPPADHTDEFAPAEAALQAVIPVSPEPVVTPASTLAATRGAATSTVPAPFAPLDFFTFDARDQDVVPPQAVSQEISGWWGAMGEPPAGTPLGAIDLVIDDAGRVVEAHIHRSVNRFYDAVLLQSVKQWRYRPASRGGRPVRYRRITSIVSVR
jgi:hypothetical protein